MGHFVMASLWCASLSTNTLDFASLFWNKQFVSVFNVTRGKGDSIRLREAIYNSFTHKKRNDCSYSSVLFIYFLILIFIFIFYCSISILFYFILFIYLFICLFFAFSVLN